ncbi:TlpA disulfide reductase family protein [Pedobacter mucosus]|uniref:TlpA disulfide reductase family protein n=1 Tax=Pedobacter mucosus TaxID=2895286 RepID=UPI001EE435F4|nr:TlpA disulfide reductase family protein [Pedobacter mucosus]UKT64980.1 AhpC/TSA family protein [Pedobacter mucosus]
MKYYIAILVAFFSLGVKGQQRDQSYSIRAHFKNFANSKVSLQFSTSEGSKVDTARADASGNFTFKGKVSEPQAVLMSLKRGVIYKFFLENTSYTMEGDVNDIKKTMTTGGKEQAIYDKYEGIIAEMGKFQKDMQKPILYNMKRKDTSGIEAFIYATTIIWRDSLLDRQVDFIAQYPSSRVSLHAMKDIVASSKPTSTMDSLMRLIEANPIASSPTALKIRQIIDNRMNASPGSMAPDFIQPDTAGKELALSELRGKYVLLDFWASWCGPCRAENPNVLKAYQKYRDDNFTVLAVSIDVNRASWVKAIKKDQLPWKQLGDLKAANAAARLYGVVSIPRNFLIDPMGKIVAMDLRGANLDKVLGETFGKKLK